MDPNIIYISMLLFLVACFVVDKAGYPAWYALVAAVPYVNVLFLLAFAFMEWPIQRELARYKEQVELADPKRREEIEKAECLSCKTPLSAGVTDCPKCGWSYVQDD